MRVSARGDGGGVKPFQKIKCRSITDTRSCNFQNFFSVLCIKMIALLNQRLNRVVWICVAVFALSASASPAQPPTTSPPSTPTEVTLDGLKSVAPASWKAVKPSNRLRSYQFKLPRVEGDKEDAELFIMPDMQGTAEQNFARWKELFIPPPDMSKADAAKEGKLQLGKAVVSTIDLRGTYHLKHIPIDVAVKEVRPDYRMLAAMWVSPDAKISIRLIGPKKTVEAHAKAYDSWLKNFK